MQSKLDSLNPRATEDKDRNRPELIDEKMFAAIEGINQRTSKLYSHESDLLNSIIVVVEGKRTGSPWQSLTKGGETSARVEKLRLSSLSHNFEEV
uniref:Uncharacterized protein n=1 Tax=Vespula pensylvanica TaxID=30213 RepID=A0A834UAD3_VESPE|nr:hypothetical protein H0235_008015 [Vespula pensylvanica]